MALLYSSAVRLSPLPRSSFRSEGLAGLGKSIMSSLTTVRDQGQEPPITAGQREVGVRRPTPGFPLRRRP